MLRVSKPILGDADDFDVAVKTFVQIVSKPGGSVTSITTPKVSRRSLSLGYSAISPSVYSRFNSDFILIKPARPVKYAGAGYLTFYWFLPPDSGIFWLSK